MGDRDILQERLLFLETFLKRPKQIGSVTPSSGFLRKSMLKHVNFKKARYIVEYGAGTGAFTKAILEHARKDAIILCFEINKRFCSYLKKSIKDKRLIIVNDDASHIRKYMEQHNISHIDYVLSSLPFFQLTEKKKKQIISATKEVLNNSGKFILYRYSHNFKQYLNYYFGKISRVFVPLNLPPTFVYICQK